jgi:hypothetical protein
MQYKYRIYLWNATQGISFKPANGAYYVSTTFTALPPTITINAFDCAGWKVSAGYNSNDPATLIKFNVDTSPNLNSIWMKTTLVVVGAGNVLNQEINLNAAPMFGVVHYIKAYIVNSGYADSSALDQCLPLGVNETADEKVGIKIFPNPMVEASEVICDKNIEGKLTLFDRIGRLIKEVPIIEGKGRIEGNDLPNGLYICKIVDKEGLLLENRKISVVK